MNEIRVDATGFSFNEITMEPPCKKSKSKSALLEKLSSYMDDLKNCSNLKAILSDDFDQPLPMTTMQVGHLKDKKNISKAILTLNEKVPLKNYTHLKRARGRNIILGPSDYFSDTSLQEFIETKTPELKDLFEYFKLIEVPAIGPKLRKSYNPLIWPLNFHPDKYLESLSGGYFFSQQEMELNIELMRTVFMATKWFVEKKDDDVLTLEDVNTTLVFDPHINSVVAIAFSNKNHPIQHSTMVAIDAVAKTQNGGAWDHSEAVNSKLNGIDAELLSFLQDNSISVRFGSRPFMSKRDFVEAEDRDFDPKLSPYLCTGYYVYALKEPCIMCAMGLVHSRAKRVLFCFSNEKSGGLQSKTKLQAVTALNHHFEVFTGFLKDADL